jgi:hypothetical protein
MTDREVQTVQFEDFLTVSGNLLQQCHDSDWAREPTKSFIDHNLFGIDDQGDPLHVEFRTMKIDDVKMSHITERRDYDSAWILNKVIAATEPLAWWTTPRDPERLTKSLGILYSVPDPNTGGTVV